MANSSIHLAEEALSLPSQQRGQLTKLLMQNLQEDGRSDEEITAELRTRLSDLKSGKDAGWVLPVCLKNRFEGCFQHVVCLRYFE